MASRKVPAPALPQADEPAGVPARTQAATWRLPSGQDLVSFALATGFAAQPLLEEQAAPRDRVLTVEDQPQAVNGVRREV